MSKTWYLKSLEENYKQEYNWKNINDETIKSNIEYVLKQINSIMLYWININFLTDYSYKWLKSDLWINNEHYFYNGWDLISNAFEIANKIWADKIIYLTKKSITWLVYWKTEKLNYVNPNILKKIQINWRNREVIKKVIQLLSEKNNLNKRFHFVNILKDNALYNELFTLYWEWNWDWVLVSLDYKLEIEKLKNTSEEELIFLHNILKELSENNWFVKYKDLNYIKENIANFYVYKIDWASVGMFEIKELWNFSKEIWTVILDSKFSMSRNMN